MFVIFATKPLNDNTAGFRFNFLGQKGLVRRRKHKSNGFGIERMVCMTRYDLGKLSVYLERPARAPRVLAHFAG